MRLYLLTYNNYKNRRVKVLNSISDYAAYTTGGSSYLTETNFNPNDGVSTTQIVGSGTVPWIYGDPDYVVVTDDTGSTIISRWFCLESVRLRYGQYRLTLRRDVLADYKSIILTNPAMIAKAQLSISDDRIFNSEPMTFSQIKKKEILLDQANEQGWVVGYIAPPNADTTISWPVDSGIYAPEYASLADIPYYDNSKIIRLSGNTITNSYKTVQYGAQAFGVRWTENGAVENIDYETTVYSKSDFESNINSHSSSLNSNYYLTLAIANAIGPNVAGMQATIGDDIQTSVDAFFNSIGKYYKVGTTLYKVTGYLVRTRSNQTTAVTSADFPGIFSLMTTYAGNAGLSGTPNNSSFYMYGDISQAILVVEEQQAATRSLTIKSSARALSDAPYSMFCLPLSGYYVLDGVTYHITPEQSLKVGMEIAKGLSNACYDIQILPYCPRQDFLSGSTLFLGNTGGNQYGVEDEDYVKIMEGANVVGAICFCNSSSFQFSLYRNNILDISSDPIQFKVDSQTRFVRICSPNYNGQFEFTPEKNGGIKYFDIFNTYKPFNPYIQVAPRFNRLYGTSYADARGLICAGDWSIPQTSDAWVNFELSNKNYQQSFDREIQSIELRNDRQKLMDTAAAITGTVGGGFTGAATGATVGGGPVGAVVGAVVGTAGSAIAGGMDVAINEELRKDALDLKKDLFSFQMQNIRAVPQSLTRVGAITKVFKVFPFLEIYDAPQVEKTALYNKILYNGMTVMSIGKIEDYLQSSPTWIQGSFIWLDGLAEDYHIAEVINEEFEKGVYI